MSVREYVGARYVPVFATPIDWNSANTYEPLTIVLHEGNSYTSRQAVPAGIQITNTAYWAQTGNYNAQIEQYRQDVAALASRFPVSVLDGGTGGTDAATARSNLDAAQADGATNTLYDAEQAIAANAADIISLLNFMSRIFLADTVNQIRFYCEDDWFDIGIKYPSDSEYPYRVISFSHYRISFQKRPSNYSSSQAVELWRYNNPIS